jgi:hypothetical protein
MTLNNQNYLFPMAWEYGRYEIILHAVCCENWCYEKIAAFAALLNFARVLRRTLNKIRKSSRILAVRVGWTRTSRQA